MENHCIYINDIFPCTPLTIFLFLPPFILDGTLYINYASRRSRRRDTVIKLTVCLSVCVCVCVCIPAVTAQRLQCDEN